MGSASNRLGLRLWGSGLCDAPRRSLLQKGVYGVMGLQAVWVEGKGSESLGSAGLQVSVNPVQG